MSRRYRRALFCHHSWPGAQRKSATRSKARHRELLSWKGFLHVPRMEQARSSFVQLSLVRYKATVTEANFTSGKRS